MPGPEVIAYGQGVRGNLTWVTDQRPKNFREQLLFLFPNGDAPLTAIASKLAQEALREYEFNWWSKALPLQSGVTAGIFEDALLADPYDAGDDYALGTTAHAQVTAALAKEFRPGHLCLIRNSAQSTNDLHAKVTNVALNGASSVITFRLLEADGASHMADDMSTATDIVIYGNSNPQGGTISQPVSYQMTKLTNFTQIWRTPLAMTRTARMTKLRGPDQYREMKREALQMHGVEMEKSWLWGIPTEVVGDNGEPETTTGGLFFFIRQHASDHVFDYKTDTGLAFAGKTWKQAGEDWLDEKLEVIFRYGAHDRLAYVGSGALLGIQQIAKLSGQMTITQGQGAFGTKITTWVTPFGNIHMQRHPLFSYESTTRHRMLILTPENLRERYVTQTHFKKDDSEKKAGQIGYDGIKEEFLTESGLEVWHPHTHADFDGIGKNNAV